MKLIPIFAEQSLGWPDAFFYSVCVVVGIAGFCFLAKYGD